ncbi:uncharacterized protein METZ01_LOCUS509818, partial [marine metagenome]
SAGMKPATFTEFRSDQTPRRCLKGTKKHLVLGETGTAREESTTVPTGHQRREGL